MQYTVTINVNIEYGMGKYFEEKWAHGFDVIIIGLRKYAIFCDTSWECIGPDITTKYGLQINNDKKKNVFLIILRTNIMDFHGRRTQLPKDLNHTLFFSFCRLLNISINS